MSDGIELDRIHSASFSPAVIHTCLIAKMVANMKYRALPVNPDGLTNELDIQTLFFRLTLDSATEFLFGQTVGKF